MSGTVTQLRGSHVPTDVVQRLTIRPDYVDHHALHTSDARRWPAQTWARAMFEDGRRPVDRGRDLGLLGLMLADPQPPGRVAGWTIDVDEPEQVRMSSAARNTRDQVLLAVEGDRVWFATAVEYLSPAGQVLWPAMAVLHRRFAPRVLRRAEQRLHALA